MLIRLGRWLRAAGYDTAIAAGGAADRDLVDLAVREDRLLLTRDRRLAELRGAWRRVVVLDGNSVAACAEELTARLRIDWLRRPFSRCMVCNASLRAARPKRSREAPPAARGAGGRILCCPACDRLYWPGGHVRRMHRRLTQWSGGDQG